jgi:excisionase family DNA binding protein
MAESPVVLLSRAEAAERLRVSERTVRRYGKSGLLDARRVGPKLVMITEQSVEALKQKDAAAPRAGVS